MSCKYDPNVIFKLRGLHATFVRIEWPACISMYRRAKRWDSAYPLRYNPALRQDLDSQCRSLWIAPGFTCVQLIGSTELDLWPSPPLDSGISGKLSGISGISGKGGISGKSRISWISGYSGRDLTGFPDIPDCLNIFPDFPDIPEIKWGDDHGCGIKRHWVVRFPI